MITEKVSTGVKLKVHSLIDKVYHPTNLQMAWVKVKANKGAGGIDGIYIGEFEKVAEEQLKALHENLKEETYNPLPVKRIYIPKRGKPKERRPLGIPTVRDRVCQQALKNRLEPIFEDTFNNCSFGYRPARSPHHAMRKIWQEIKQGNQWIVDADLHDYFGTVNHKKLIDMVAEKVSDGRILNLIAKMLKAGYIDKKCRFETKVGTPQGSVISPLLSNIYLTPFDNAITDKGFKLTRFADDWLITCKSKAEAEKALKAAKEELAKLGLALNKNKTRITNIKWGFEFLGYKIKQGKGLKLAKSKIKIIANKLNLYAFPSEASINRFMDIIRQRTKRRISLTLKEIVENINPVIRGWGNYYHKANVRKLFNRLDRWVIRRLWSHQYKRWRNTGWKKYPTKRLYAEFGLVNLIQLIPGLERRPAL